MLKSSVLVLIGLFVLICTESRCQSIDLSRAQVVCSITDKKILRRSLELLQQEVEKRSGIKLLFSRKVSGKAPAIYIALESDLSVLPARLREPVNRLPELNSEGYKLLTLEKESAVVVVGKDARGLLYGIGRLLRKLDMQPGKLAVPEALAISTSPRYPVRGHQLGYRPKTNSYDAFTVAQFDQYIRDLALFGANSIEIMPPRTDDDFTSPHMKLPAINMIAEQSRICNEYGLDVWMWYPNLGKNYSHPDSIAKELKERHAVFAALPRLDHVFVPAGDPGDLEPEVLFTWLGEMAKALHQHHPKAKIWVSPQVFKPTKEWYDVFFSHVNREYPWFGGVVFGPWVKMPVADIRQRIKPSIPIRNYPDITHTFSAQYPVPHWDLAYAMALGREPINPRPQDEKTIHNALDEYAIGSISYSEGTNDDVNKFVWSDQDWNPETPVIETLRDYARLFIGAAYTESFAQGLLALERNWRGPLLTNTNVAITLQQWQHLEKTVPRRVQQNPRYQMGLIRAYFDAYIQRRLLYETGLEEAAKDVLSGAQADGSLSTMGRAKQLLEKAWKEPILPEYRQTCFALADSLYKSIGAQLTIKKHGAMAGRGNFIDNMSLPLNDAPWMLSEFSRIEKLNTEPERLAQLEALLHRTDPGPGGFYDHFGAPESWYRVVPGLPWAQDPGSLRSPRTSFGVGLVGDQWMGELEATGSKGQITPKVWMKQAKTLYDEPLKIAYTDLDPITGYRIRIAYTGRFRSRMKLMTDDGQLVHDFIKTGEQPIYEFDVPPTASADGKITFIWTCGEGERGAQVTEIWLIKKPTQATRNTAEK